MDVDAKMAGVHAIAAVGAAYISFIVSNGSIAVLGNNQALGTLAGLVILIIVGLVIKFAPQKRNKENDNKKWMMNIKVYHWSGVGCNFFMIKNQRSGYTIEE